MEFYLHIGLHKTGTTTMQKAVFPNLSGVEYLGRPFSENHFLFDLLRSDRQKVLVSSESIIGKLTEVYGGPFGEPNYSRIQCRNLERLSRFAPRTRIIIGVRPHRPWIESVYKHYLKYGGTLDFKTFFSPCGSSSLMHFEDFLFMPRLEIIRTFFDEPPFVYDQEDLKKEPDSLVSRLCEYMGIEPQKFKKKLPEMNVGTGEKRGNRLRKINAYPSLRFLLNSRLAKKYNLDPFSISGFRISEDSPIRMQEEVAEFVREKYRADWRQAKNLAGI